MREIELSGRKAAGRSALVSDEDYELVASHTWHVWEPRPPKATWRQSGPYAHTNVRRPDGRYTSKSMHILITGWARTDHRDGNGLNNCRDNLRDVSNTQNLQNSRPHVGSSSPYKGVYWCTEAGRWRTQITVNGRCRHIGDFADEIDAALAYDAKAREYFGEFALPNFGPGGLYGDIPAGAVLLQPSGAIAA